MKYNHVFILFILIIYDSICNTQGYLIKQNTKNLNCSSRRFIFRQSGPCRIVTMCRSRLGFCGYGDEFCGPGCQYGPCINDSQNIINNENFQCAFNNLNDTIRKERLEGLRQSGWKPENKDEGAVFLAHVYHETDGLRTLVEYCAPGCGPNYNLSWCDIQAVPGKFYYGRGWFQLSYPCNYYAAGNAIGLDLLNNPDFVSQLQYVAVQTAVWFFQANNMVEPARQGDFAATTRIINGAQECDGGPGTINQQTRVATYKRIRLCFGLGEPTKNSTC